MASNLSQYLRRRCPVLFEDKMPVWLTILISLSAALAAYLISPAVNRQFQIDATRSTHVATTTENLNKEIILLSEKIRRLNSALVNEPKAAPAIREDCLDLITQLQWQLVDLRIVLTNADDSAAVNGLASSLTDVKTALDSAVDASAQPKLITAMKGLGEQARDVLNRLYTKASLK